MYIIASFSLSSNTEIISTLNDPVRNSSPTKRLVPLVAIVEVFLRLIDNPEYLVESDKTGKEAAHKPEALKKIED